jgi:hypothetical protein
MKQFKYSVRDLEANLARLAPAVTETVLESNDLNQQSSENEDKKLNGRLLADCGENSIETTIRDQV